MQERLYRSIDNKIIGGVCGGLAEYFAVDATLVRILTVLAMLLPGIGILTYIIAWIIIPSRPLDVPQPRQDQPLSPWNRYLPGLILIGLGVILLVREYYFWFDWSDIWPVAIILLGLALILVGLPRRHDSSSADQTHRVNGENGGTIS